MFQDTEVITNSEFLLRRLQEGVPFWALFFPPLFALAVVGILALFRIDRHLVDQVVDKLVGVFKPIFPGVLWPVFGGLLSLLFFLLVYISLAAAAVTIMSLVTVFFLFQRGSRFGNLGIATLGILVLSLPYFALSLLFKDFFGWWLILTPVLVVAMVYIVLMYYRDAQTIHPILAAFLGLLRCTVYAILAFVFLLPGRQFINTFETQARVLLLFDVSDSMNNRDDLPQPGQRPEDRLTRQDKVIKIIAHDFLRKDGHKRSFQEELRSKSPFVAYRFGGVPDEEGVVFDSKTLWDNKDWKRWLTLDPEQIKPKADMTEAEKTKYVEDRRFLFDRMRNSTDLGGSALRLTQRESSGYIQAVIIYSDGMNNKGSEEAYRQLVNWASNPAKPVHIFTVGVGEYHQPTRIRLNPLRAPSTVRPDDEGFKVVVPVFGDGMPGERITVHLEGTRIEDKEQRSLEFVKDANGVVVKKLNPKVEFKDSKEVKLSGGEFPSAEVEFTVNLAKALGIDPKKDDEAKLQGKWRFVARVPRHPKENFGEQEHVSDPGKIVQVIDRQLKVLIVAGGPSRDYQFARTMFHREALADRVNLALYLQTAADEDVHQDVDPKYLLTQFPNKLETGKKTLDDPYNLKRYDVIIAFDFNWKALDARQIELLNRWSTEEKGGLIFVSGDTNTDSLATPGEDEAKLRPLLSLLPVTLKDSRDEEAERVRKGLPPLQRENPTKLFFKDVNDYPFINLDGEKIWEEFFHPKDDVRGFYRAQPIQEKSLIAKTVAEFDTEGGTPYFVIATPQGKGKTFYIGSEESWRLRLFNKDLHQKFWMKLAAFVSSGSDTKKQGKIFMAEDYVTGQIKIEAEVRDLDGNLAKESLKPEVILKRPEGFNKEVDPVTPEKFKLTAKDPNAATWNGIFSHTIEVKTTGVYTVQIKVPESTELLSHTFVVHPINIELGNLKTNFLSLYQMATEARSISERLGGEDRKKFEQMLRQSMQRIQNMDTKDPTQPLRLFVEEKQAHLIADFLEKLKPDRRDSKAGFKELWDEGWKPSPDSLTKPKAISTEQWQRMSEEKKMQAMMDYGLLEPVLLPAPYLLFLPGGLGGFMCLLLLISGRWKALAVVGGVTVVALVALLIVISSVWGLSGNLQLIMMMSAYYVLLIVPVVVATVAVLILLVIGRWIAAIVTVVLTGLVIGGLAIYNNSFHPEWVVLPLHMSWVLLAVVGLLSLEWLMRKLLKLA